MGRAETLTAVREKFPQYADMPDDALGSALAAKYPEYADLAGKPEPAPKAGVKEWAQGAVDTMGLGRKGARTPVDVALKPQGGWEHLAQGMMAAPAIMSGGAGLAAVAARLGLPGAVTAAAPLVGRAATSGAIGGAQKAAAGGDAWDVAKTVIADAAMSAGTEGVIAGGLRRLGAPARAFREATAAPTGEALTQAEQRVGRAAWMNIPSISRQPITAREAAESLQSLEGGAYAVRLAEIVSELNRVQQVAGVTGPRAGDLFARLVSDERVTPNMLARFLEAVRTNPRIRAIADTPVEGYPVGAIGIAAGTDKFGSLARHILPHAIAP